MPIILTSHLQDAKILFFSGLDRKETPLTKKEHFTHFKRDNPLRINWSAVASGFSETNSVTTARTCTSR